MSKKSNQTILLAHLLASGERQVNTACLPCPEITSVGCNTKSSIGVSSVSLLLGVCVAPRVRAAMLWMPFFASSACCPCPSIAKPIWICVDPHYRSGLLVARTRMNNVVLGYAFLCFIEFFLNRFGLQERACLPDWLPVLSENLMLQGHFCWCLASFSPTRLEAIKSLLETLMCKVEGAGAKSTRKKQNTLGNRVIECSLSYNLCWTERLQVLLILILKKL